MTSRSSFSVPKKRFLLGISYVYLFAFASFYIQIPGLYGDDGILPARLLTLSPVKNFDDFVRNPNLLRFSSFLKLDNAIMMELCALVGIVLALLSVYSSKFRTFPVYLFLWLNYFSVLKAGQTFLWFQWDILLVEAGFLAIIFSKIPIYSVSHCPASDRICIWLLRWLLFRLMFASGVVKLTSGCPSWWGLKALNWHYQSQCIPNPIAWYAHHMPDWFHQLCVSCTLIFEIILPLLFFVPLRIIRNFSFYTQVLLQVAIMLTGNFNFFNILTIVLCYSLLYDEDFRPRRQQGGSGYFSDVLSCVIIAGALLIGGYLFQFSISPDFTIKTSVGFSKSQFEEALYHTIMFCIFLSVALYFWEVWQSLLTALRARQTHRKILACLGTLGIGTIGLMLLFSSMVPLASLHDGSAHIIPPSVRRIHNQLQPYHLTNSYGLFRRITGVGGRPEIIIEAADSEFGPWTEYQFLFKPGKLDRTPPVVLPHQPRLDWQMWFAALSTPERQPWFYSLVYRLLQGNSDVLHLMNTTSMPIKPTFVRASLYTYHFTNPEDATGNWWRRVRVSDYLSPVSLSSPKLLSVLEELGLIGKRRQKPMDPTLLSVSLFRIRKLVGTTQNLSPLWVVCLLLGLSQMAVTNAADQRRI